MSQHYKSSVIFLQHLTKKKKIFLLIYIFLFRRDEPLGEVLLKSHKCHPQMVIFRKYIQGVFSLSAEIKIWQEDKTWLHVSKEGSMWVSAEAEKIANIKNQSHTSFIQHFSRRLQCQETCLEKGITGFHRWWVFCQTYCRAPKKTTPITVPLKLYRSDRTISSLQLFIWVGIVVWTRTSALSLFLSKLCIKY